MVRAPKGRGAASPAAPGAGTQRGRRQRPLRAARARHQLLQLPLPVAQLLACAPRAPCLQGRDDLQLRVVVVDDVVLQHQQQICRDRRRVTAAGDPGQGCPARLRGPTLACPEPRELPARKAQGRGRAPCDRRSSSPPLRDAGASPAPVPPSALTAGRQHLANTACTMRLGSGTGGARDRPGSSPAWIAGCPPVNRWA